LHITTNQSLLCAAPLDNKYAAILIPPTNSYLILKAILIGKLPTIYAPFALYLVLNTPKIEIYPLLPIGRVYIKLNFLIYPQSAPYHLLYNFRDFNIRPAEKKLPRYLVCYSTETFLIKAKMV